MIVSGVDKDGPIERWWDYKDRELVLASLKQLGITLITTPNFSLLTDVPRTDNLHAMKRIFAGLDGDGFSGFGDRASHQRTHGARLPPVGRPHRRAVGD